MWDERYYLPMSKNQFSILHLMLGIIDFDKEKLFQ